jgi:YVTN family beta-propeller protein
MNLKQIIVTLFYATCFAACTEPTIEPAGTYTEGVFTVNEGVFMQTSGTITHYNRNSQSATIKIFNKANNRDLGDVVQSLYFYEEKAYIIVNNSNKIEVADGASFIEKAQITGLKLPRYFMPISRTKGYVSEWGLDGLTGTIAILNLTSNTIENRIAVGKGPEGLLFKDDKLYVAHSGGLGSNSIVTVINTSTDQVATTLNVLDNPATCVEDVDGNVWVACSGKTEYLNYPNIDTVNSTASGLIKISTITNTVSNTIIFGKGNPVTDLIINSTNKNELYYSRAGKVWSYNVTTGIENQLFVGSFYGLGFDSQSNYIYAATSSGVNAAYAKRYQANGTLVDSFQVGVFANGFVFK